MQNETNNQKQVLKELFFKNENKLFSKKSKFVSYTCKDTTQILSNIASKPRFSQIRQRYKVYKFISKILLKDQLNWVLYTYYRNNILYIATKNHIGQSELNLQKITLIKYFKKHKDYKNIISVNIFRDEKKYENIKNIKKSHHLNFKERSYGIFTNALSNQKHCKIAEKIRLNIKNIVN